jgi:hypothetical protein
MKFIKITETHPPVNEWLYLKNGWMKWIGKVSKDYGDFYSGGSPSYLGYDLVCQWRYLTHEEKIKFFFLSYVRCEINQFFNTSTTTVADVNAVCVAPLTRITSVEVM